MRSQKPPDRGFLISGVLGGHPDREACGYGCTTGHQNGRAAGIATHCVIRLPNAVGMRADV